MVPIGFIDSNLLAELQRKRSHLISRVSDDDGFRRKIANAAHQDALYHSKIIEPDQAKRSRVVGRRIDFRETRENLDDAWRHAQKTFNERVTEEFVLSLANKIEPITRGIYRLDRVIIPDYHIDIPPGPEKIREQMNALFLVMNNILINPVERALLFHFQFLRIHPLIDGNGRTSRFVQNLLLSKSDYAPPILPVGERSFYNDLIHNARMSFKERGSTGEFRDSQLIGIPPGRDSAETRFYNYLAAKVNVGMDDLFDRFDRFPHYQIDLSGVKDPGQILRVKKVIQSYLVHRGEIGDVKVVERKSGRIELRANVNDSELSNLLDKRSRMRYKITRFD